MKHVEFVKYTGRWPNLCRGILVLLIDGKEVKFDQILSGGDVCFTEDWQEIVTHGPWKVEVPEEYKKYETEINQCMNDNVTWGCCGGCV